jgi:hypothetical protein
MPALAMEEEEGVVVGRRVWSHGCLYFMMWGILEAWCRDLLRYVGRVCCNGMLRGCGTMILRRV